MTQLYPKPAQERKVCKVEGCELPGYRKGWCCSHYCRWKRHGNPLLGSTGMGEVSRWIHDVALRYDADDCLDWPFSKGINGYGIIKLSDKMTNASRHICGIVHGPAPSPTHHAGHSCGKGHLGCVNPRHLLWMTPSDNQKDRIKHGTHGRGVKNPAASLTEKDVLEIRSLKGKISQRRIAEIFGVSQAHVSDIQRKKRWGWL